MSENIRDFTLFLLSKEPVYFGSHIYIYLSCNEDDTVSVSYYVTTASGIKPYKSITFLMETLTSRESLVRIITESSVPIDTILMKYNRDTQEVEEFTINGKPVECSDESHGTYQYKKDLSKIVLTFDKDWYMSLDEKYKKSVKSNFLFSRKTGSWISRAKFPNLLYAEKTATELGLTKLDDDGEVVSFEDQMKKKADKAERRAERYQQYAENAEKRGEHLQSGFREAAKDIAFVTQPNINSSGGRAFTKYRNRLLAAYDRGIEEFKKSDYYKDRAATALVTADETKPTDKAFISRRLRECEKTISTQRKHLDRYYSFLDRINGGEVVKKSGGALMIAEDVESAIDRVDELLDRELSKVAYYLKCLDDIGGVMYSKQNIKKGYLIQHSRWGKCYVAGTGPKNFSYVIAEGGAKGMGGYSDYAEIESIISTEVNLPKHPFKVGETYSCEVWSKEESQYVTKEYKVTKITDERVTLKSGTARAVSYVPKRFSDRESKTGYRWKIVISESLNGTIYRNED